MLTTPQPAGPGDDDSRAMPLPGEQAALDALTWHWGEAYHIGVSNGQWWYQRRDGKGGPQTAASPDDLRKQIVTDYLTRPVPRDPPAPTSASRQNPAP